MTAMPETIEALVDGGEASAGPPLGPALGPLGVNIMEVINTINERTKDFAGMKVPVKVVVDPKSKEFDIEVGTPPTTALILQEVGLEKGSGEPDKEKVGNLSLDGAVRIANMKQEAMLGKSLKSRVKEVAGSAWSCGVNVDGKDARAFIAEVNEGRYDARLPEE